MELIVKNNVGDKERKSFFAQLIIKLGNSPPQDVVLATGRDGFKWE